MDIEEIKAKTDLCDTFSCYENCEECVAKYIEEIKKKKLPLWDIIDDGEEVQYSSLMNLID